MNSQIKERVKELCDLLNYHNNKYYNDDAPEISDAEYDKLYAELTALESKYPDLTLTISPTQRVGGMAVLKTTQHEHKVPLLSLDSLFSKEDAYAFITRMEQTLKQTITLFAEPKFDGLSLALTYVDAQLTVAATRGNGLIGEDVTNNSRTMKSIPHRLNKDLPGLFVVRGEVIMTLDGFERINADLIKSGKEPFANPRNAASGSLRQLDVDLVASRPLEFIAYDVMYSDSALGGNQHDLWSLLSDLGFKTAPDVYRGNNFDELQLYYEGIGANRNTLNYEIDGIVVKLDNLNQREVLGYKSRSPRWAFAWKFEPRIEETIVDNVIAQVGRQGTITPVALLRPVDVGGVTVSRATLHNYDFVKKLDLHIGDFVKIARAGDVIPEVVEVLKSKRCQTASVISVPYKCPICNSEVMREGAFIFCLNGYSCPAQKKWSLIHFASKKAMDIDGLGEETIDQLLSKSLVNSPADIYTLDFETLSQLDGFKDKKIKNLLDAIQKSKTSSLARLIYALGIRQVGEETARLLENHYLDLQNIYQASEEDFLLIRGIGPETAKYLYNYFSNPENRQMIQRIINSGIQFIPQKKNEKLILNGKTLVVTGELKMGSRQDIENQIRALGGHPSASVSKKTSYVIFGENAGSKYKKALELGVPVLSEEEFIKLVTI